MHTTVPFFAYTISSFSLNLVILKTGCFLALPYLLLICAFSIMLVVRYSLAMVSGAGGGLLTTSILYRASVSDVSAKKAGMPLASFGIVPAIAQINI